MNNVLAKEEALVGARNDHVEAMKEYGNLNPVVKGVVRAISSNPTQSNQDLFPRPMTNPSKKQRDRKRRKLLHEASGANSAINSSVNDYRSLD